MTTRFASPEDIAAARRLTGTPDVLPDGLPENTIETWAVPSAKSPHRFYTVSKRADTKHGGTYMHCDCAAWPFAYGRGGTCSHVKAIIESLNDGSTDWAPGAFANKAYEATV
jgi:hypothetical protein